MNHNRAIKLQQQAQNRMRDLFSRARHFHLSHERMLEERSKIRASVAKCPRWVYARLEGYWDSQIERLYEEELEYCYRLNGNLYSINRDSARNYEKAGFGPRACYETASEHGHYWKDTDSPFFTGAK